MAVRDSLRRRRARRDPFPRILIACEGKRTEKGYFSHIRHSERLPINLEIISVNDPSALLDRALELKADSQRDARRFSDDTRLFDEIWCVFDVDRHPRLDQVKSRAQASSIHVAISNPCFELWVLLHFQDYRKPETCATVQQLLNSHLPEYTKALPCERIMSLSDGAIARARGLDHWQETRNNLGGNPSTQVYKLLEKLRSYRSFPQ